MHRSGTFPSASPWATGPRTSGTSGPPSSRRAAPPAAPPDGPPGAPSAKKPSLGHRAWRAARAALLFVAALGVFVIALIAGVLTHLGTAPARRLVATQLPALLEGAFPGRVEIRTLGALSIGGVGRVDVDVFHPDGGRVALLRGVTVEIDTLQTVRSLSGDGPLVIPIEEVSADAVDVDVSGEEGSFRIVETFVDPDAPVEPEDPQARGLDLRIEELALRHVWAHGVIDPGGGGAPVLADADLDDVLARLSITPETTTLALDHADLTTRSAPRGADVRARLHAAFTMPTGAPAADAPATQAGPMAVSFAVNGTIAGSPISVIGSLHGEALHAFVVAPAIAPEQLRVVAPEAPPLAATASLVATAHGSFDHVVGKATLLVGESRVTLDADAVLAPAIVARVHLDGRSLDVSVVGGPKSTLSLTADAELRVPEEGDPTGEVTLATEPGVVAGVAVPAMVGGGSFRGATAKGELDIHEPGMLTHLAVSVAPGPPGPEGAAGSIIEAKLDAPRVELAKLAGRGVDARGVLGVAAEGRVDLGAEHIAARATIRGTALSSPMAADAAIGSLTAKLRASGALADPELAAQVDARTVRVAGKRIDWARIGVSGTARHARIDAQLMSVDLPRIRAHTLLHLEPALALTGTTVDATRGRTTAHLQVARVDLGGAGLPAVRDLTVDGLGDRLTASVVPTPGGGAHLLARSTRIALASVSELAGVDLGISRGAVALDADVTVGGANAGGEIAVEVQEVHASQAGLRVEGLDLRLYATLEGRRAVLDLFASAPELGRIEVTTRRPLELAGPSTEANSWMQATGQIALDGDIDLGAASRLVPAAMLPVADVGGRLVVVGHADREARGRAPTCALAARTDALTVVGKAAPPPPGSRAAKPFRVDPNPAHATLTAASERAEGRTDRAMGPAKPTMLRPEPGEEALADPTVPHGGKPDPTPTGALSLRGVDVDVNIACATDPREHVSVTASARDAAGALVTLQIDSDVGYGRLLDGRMGDGVWLEETPFTLHAAIPSRRIDGLPRSLGLPRAQGRVSADLLVEGTARTPTLTLDAALAGLSIERTPLQAPFTTKLVARYDGKTAVAHLAIDQSTTRLLKGVVEAEIAMEDVLRQPSGKPLPWTASADVELGPLPLDILQAVLPAKIEGLANGRIQLERLQQDASLDVDVSVDGLVVGGIEHRVARLEVKAKDGLFDGRLRLVQPSGSLEADARVGIDWGARLLPLVKADRRFDVGLRARSFRLRAVEPFVASTFHRLDGRLDGSVHLSSAAIQEALRSGGATGKLVLERGRMELAAAGGQLDDVRATVRLDERGILRLEDVFARGQTGEVRAAGLVTFGGPTFFHTARLDVVVPTRRPMPLLIQGEHLADVAGRVKVDASFRDRGEELRVDVDIPRLVVTLPDRLPDGVQKLDDIDRARVGTVRNGRFVPLPLDAPDPAAEATPSAFRTRVDIHVRDATIEMGDMLRTQLTGNPTLVLEDGETVMAGAITIRGGRVDIKGRLFEIERGTITFGDDPANPDVILTASWEAPDGTRVYADFAGPLQTGKVTLRSNPPRSRDEIIALVVFGRVEGYQPGGERADTTTQAVGAAGGFATRGLNKALDDITSLEIRTRVDTSSSTNPKPELEVQISQEVAVKISYILGELAPGQAADKTFATVDWNFEHDWSLETTVGDKASTTVDMIWEHLY